MITFLKILEHVYCVLATILIVAELWARSTPVMHDTFNEITPEELSWKPKRNDRADGK